MRCLRSRRSAFTLIELMVVIAIIGILAAIAVLQYMRFQLKSKSVEAKSNLKTIRIAETVFFSEFATYVAAEPTPWPIPGSVPGPFAPLTDGFRELGFAATGRVFFSYAIAVSPDGTGYTAEAAADLDVDSVRQYWGYAVPAASGTLVPADIGCDLTNLVAYQIGACGTAFGQSVF